MTAFEPKMSERPDALKGALEWADAELERIRKEKEDAQKVYERIKPLRQEALRKLREKKTGGKLKKA